MNSHDVSTSSRIRLKTDGVKWKEVSGTIVVMDLNSSNYFAVEGSIASVWPSLAAGAVVGDLAQQISDEYEAPLDAITDDLITLLGQLLARGVVEHV